MALDFPSSPTNGQSYAGYVYDSTLPGWRNSNSDTGIGTLNAMGLKNVVPSSVSVGSGSASVNANGTITFSGANGVSMNNIFTSTYNNYRIDINLSSTSGSSGGFCFRLRSSGADRTTSNYYTSGLISNAGGTTGGYCANAVAQGDMGPMVANSSPFISSILEVSDPAKVLMTKFKSQMSGLNTSLSQACYVTASNLHNLDQAHDGITIYGSSSTLMNGTINVYGLTN